ncbi:MAG: response regulator, partial [Clostridia bacterium]|nr:response regulator [Clostridia bacterium]
MEKKNTVLIVDDAFANRALLKKALSGIYHVLEAESGDEALGVMRDTPTISIIVLDLMMPGTDGYAVMRAMRDDVALCEIPVVVVTGKEDEESQLKALELGAQDVIHKPFSAKIVLQRIKNILARQESILAAEQSEAYKAELQWKEEQL